MPVNPMQYEKIKLLNFENVFKEKCMHRISCSLKKKKKTRNDL